MEKFFVSKDKSCYLQGFLIRSRKTHHDEQLVGSQARAGPALVSHGCGHDVHNRKWPPSQPHRRPLAEGRTGVNFNNILLEPFSYQSISCSFSLVTVWFIIFGGKNIAKKDACKMLMKLTTGRTSPERAAREIKRVLTSGQHWTCQSRNTFWINI